MFENTLMNGAEFIRRVQKVGRRRGMAVQFVTTHGKGSHGRLYYGQRWTTVKDRKKELSKGVLRAMIRQLGLSPEDIL
jgi:predicted RNA binding protein YcfA (HicA-like mRNA interferase family)